MKNKISKRLCVGGAAVALGALIRIIQLILAARGREIAFSRPVYLAMLCLMTAGFAVISYEKKGSSSLFAICAAVACLFSSVLGNMSDGSDILRIISAVLLVATFVLSALLLIYSDGSGQGTPHFKGLLRAAAVIEIAGAILLALVLTGIVTLSPIILTALLIIMYLLLAAVCFI